MTRTLDEAWADFRDALHEAVHATVLEWLVRLEHGRPRPTRRVVALHAYVEEVLKDEGGAGKLREPD